MTMILAAVAASLLAGLAVEQAARILMQGSIFESMREVIADRATQIRYFGCSAVPVEPTWFDTKLHELISCNLCLTTQISIWFVAMPATILAWIYGPFKGLANLWLIFPFLGVAFAVSAIAMLVWNLTDYGPARYREMTQEYEVSIDNLYRELAGLRKMHGELTQDHMSLMSHFMRAVGPGTRQPRSPLESLMSTLQGMGVEVVFDDVRVPFPGHKPAAAPPSSRPTQAELSEDQFVHIMNRTLICRRIGCSRRRGQCMEDLIGRELRSLVHHGVLDLTFDIAEHRIALAVAAEALYQAAPNGEVPSELYRAVSEKYRSSVFAPAEPA